MSVSELIQWLNELDQERFQFWCSHSDAPNDDEVQSFFDESGFTLRDDFYEFTTSPLDGLHLEVAESVWPRKLGGLHWQFLYGLSIYGLSREVPDWLSLRIQWDDFEKQRQGDGEPLLPFLRVVSETQRYCFTRRGTIVLWSSDNEIEAVDHSFFECVQREFNALHERMERMVRENEASQ